MLDLDLIRNDTEKVKKALLKKIDNVDFTELLKLDDERRKLIHEVEVLKNKKNEASKQISNIKSQGGKVDESFFKDIKEISNKISELETSLEPIKGKMDTFLEALPNIPDEDVLPGEKKIIR